MEPPCEKVIRSAALNGVEAWLLDQLFTAHEKANDRDAGAEPGEARYHEGYATGFKAAANLYRRTLGFAVME